MSTVAKEEERHRAQCSTEQQAQNGLETERRINVQLYIDEHLWNILENDLWMVGVPQIFRMFTYRMLRKNTTGLASPLMMCQSHFKDWIVFNKTRFGWLIPRDKSTTAIWVCLEIGYLQIRWLVMKIVPYGPTALRPSPPYKYMFKEASFVWWIIFEQILK